MKPEQILQRECCKAFKAVYPKRLFIHIPNERKSKMEVIYLKQQGTLKGCPDILIPEPIRCGYDAKYLDDFNPKKHLIRGYSGLWVELKCGKNKPTKDQKTVMQALKERGHAVAVCYNLSDFLMILEQYFSGKWINKEGDL
mgnify:CR=1 FL=1